MNAEHVLQHAENLTVLWAQMLIEECVRSEVRMFCVSPGSRSTPLALAVHRASQVHSIDVIVSIDERAAAFYALGYARATRTPAALICTSGTALANYFPAIVEAWHDGIPMLILSADRPPELRDNGSNQTIRQPGIFGEYVLWYTDIPCPTEDIAPSVLLTTIDYAIFRARTAPSGAVHVNCMIREPLAPIQQPFSEDYLLPVQEWIRNNRAWTEYSASAIMPSDNSIENVVEILASASSPLCCVGRLRSIEEQHAVVECASAWHIPIAPDIASGLRLHHVPYSVAYIDQVLLAQDVIPCRPDVILHIGGTCVSKRMLQWIASTRPHHYIVCEEVPYRYDPNHQVTLRLHGSIVPTLKMLAHRATNTENSSGFAVDMIHASQTVEAVLQQHYTQMLDANAPISEVSVAMVVSQYIPSATGLFLSNSMPVRDMDMFGIAQYADSACAIGTNRGASGIDGILATASGFACGLNEPVTLIIGDIALLHDANSIVLAARNRVPLIIIVINNNGGGIFSFLPIASLPDALEHQAFERFWGTPVDVSFRHLAELASVPYAAPTTIQEFVAAYKHAIAMAEHERRTSLIEVCVNRTMNVHGHKDLQGRIIDALKRQVSRWSC
ncbi:MAG: 2-succinyl-5-enolpyruvyl-6-hydroxy-3-cyclohexene-1-carboxylic-acid synthase [Bacteroidota bacterium]|nr:2-succinyl-5-enolpyruvyl-6-hydroxy-3-cyclohexene-1-carboxylic-acid synthase [Candidatus Kapabacteria bacterium]MDW8220367.1 2-succinyl-5-enolpyruvyl-6-hydroxy-3-cyclohexene-1-carboxylic-acid synthase [Bacteroidota bacterium]